MSQVREEELREAAKNAKVHPRNDLPFFAPSLALREILFFLSSAISCRGMKFPRGPEEPAGKPEPYGINDAL
jgi:hypothetical protein